MFETKLQDLYKGEFAALETYRQIIETVDDPCVKDRLLVMQKGHLDHLYKLQTFLKLNGSEKPDGSGYWGLVAKTTMGVANIIGDKSSLEVLKKGEEHGLKEYEEALKQCLDPAMKPEIMGKFIPAQRKHANQIEDMIERI